MSRCNGDDQNAHDDARKSRPEGPGPRKVATLICSALIDVNYAAVNLHAQHFSVMALRDASNLMRKPIGCRQPLKAVASRHVIFLPLGRAFQNASISRQFQNGALLNRHTHAHPNSKDPETFDPHMRLFHNCFTFRFVLDRVWMGRLIALNDTPRTRIASDCHNAVCLAYGRPTPTWPAVSPRYSVLSVCHLFMREVRECIGFGLWGRECSYCSESLFSSGIVCFATTCLKEHLDIVRLISSSTKIRRRGDSLDKVAVTCHTSGHLPGRN
jgi:hypothetical protein